MHVEDYYITYCISEVSSLGAAPDGRKRSVGGLGGVLIFEVQGGLIDSRWFLVDWLVIYRVISLL
jgi:hypothetical protein